MKEIKFNCFFFLLNFKRVVKRSHLEACSLKNGHCPIVILFSNVMFYSLEAKKSN